MCTNFQPKSAQNGFWGRNSESTPPIYHVCQFLVKMDNFYFFGLNLGIWANYVKFGPITWNTLVQILFMVMQRAKWRLKWASWRWIELGGGGWSWVEVGVVIPTFFPYQSSNFFIIVRKNIYECFYKNVLLWGNLFLFQKFIFIHY